MTPDTCDGIQLEELFYVLGLVFINIRATDDLNEAQIFADIFHNVPAKISHRFETAIIMQEIHEKAARHGYESRIAKMFETAKLNCPSSPFWDSSCRQMQSATACSTAAPTPSHEDAAKNFLSEAECEEHEGG